MSVSSVRIPWSEVRDNKSHFYWQPNCRGKYVCEKGYLVPVNHVLARHWWISLNVFRPNHRFKGNDDVWPDDMADRVDLNLFTDEQMEMMCRDPVTLYHFHTHFREMVDNYDRRERERARYENRLRFRFLLCMAIWRTVYAVRMVGVKRWRQWKDDVVRKRNEAVLIIAHNAVGMN
jgi:hypothetical protein